MSNTDGDKSQELNGVESSQGSQEPQGELFDITEEVEKLFALLSKLKDSVTTELALENPDKNAVMSYLITIIQLSEDWNNLLKSDENAFKSLSMYHQFAIEQIPKDCDLEEEKKKRTPPHTSLAKKIFEQAGFIQRKHAIFTNAIKESGFNSVDLIFNQSEIVGDIYQVLMLAKRLHEIVEADNIEESSKYIEVIEKIKNDMLDILRLYGADQIK